MIKTKFINVVRRRLANLPVMKRAGFIFTSSGFSTQVSWANLPHLLTIRQAARILRVHPNTLRQWDRQNKLRAVRLGSRRDRRYEAAKVRAYYELLHESGPGLVSKSISSWAHLKSAVKPMRPKLSAVIMLVGLVVVSGGAIWASRASADTPSKIIIISRPQSCRGWEQATRVVENSKSDQRLAHLTDSNSAHINSADLRVTSRPGEVSVGALDIIDPNLTCDQFVGDRDVGALSSASLKISLGSAGRSTVMDLYFIEAFDGQKWTTIATVRSQDEGNTERSYNLPASLLADLSALKIRVRLETDPVGAPSQAWVGWMRIETSVVPTATPSKSAVTHQLDRLASFSRDMYAVDEQPQITLPKIRQKHILFFPAGEERWTLKQIRVENRTGRLQKIEFKSSDQTDGNNVETAISLDTAKLQPGRHKLQIEMIAPDGTMATIEEEFLWGVVAMNFVRPSPQPNETETVAIGVLDDQGKTICDATVEVRVTDPRGHAETYRTAKNTITKNPACVDKGVTNEPDYKFDFTPSLAGVYHVDLTAQTAVGERRITENLTVESAVKFDVQRADYPTRIYPPATYPVTVSITARQDYHGLVTEQVPADFLISETLPKAQVVNGADKKQYLKWEVDWRAGQTYQLHYTFKAPEISPALFLTGPLKIASDESQADSYFEPRQWQIASDEAGAQAFGTRLYTGGFELGPAPVGGVEQTPTALVENSVIIGSPKISSTVYRSGSYALHTNPSSTTAGVTQIFSANNDTGNEYFGRVYIYVNTAPTDTTAIMSFQTTNSTDEVSIRLSHDLRLELWDNYNNGGAAVQIGNSSNSIALQTWVRVELMYNASFLALAGRVDGYEFAADATRVSFNGTTKLSVGVLTSTTADIYWDDMAVNTDNSFGNNNWPGEGKVVYIRPNGLGTNHAMTGAATDVDDITPNDNTDYIYNTAASQLEDLTLQDSADVGIGTFDRIRVVAGNMRFANSGTTSRSIKLSIYNGSQNDAGTARSIASTTWYTNIVSSTLMSPTPTSYDLPGSTQWGPWTAADLDNVFARVTGPTTFAAGSYVKVTAVWFAVEYVPVSGGRLFSSGFELQSADNGVEWTNKDGSPTISTTTKRSGAAALRISSLSSGTRQAVNDAFWNYGYGSFYLRAYFYIATAPGAENRIIDMRDSNGLVSNVYLTLNASRQLTLYDENGVIGSASSALKTGAWYRIEWHFDNSDSPSDHTIEAKINGVSFASGTGADSASDTYQLGLGGNLNSEAQTTGEWFFDDVAINQNVGSTQNGYPGPGRIAHLRPDGDTDRTGTWVASSPCTTEYECLDEVTPNDDTDLVHTFQNNYAPDEFTLTSTAAAGIGSSDPINLVQVGVRFKNTAALATAFMVKLKDAADSVPGQLEANGIYSSKIVTSSTTWTTNSTDQTAGYPLTAYTRPEQLTAWTPSVLDNAQLGLMFTNSTTSTESDVTAEWLLVEYNPPEVQVTGTVYSNNANETTAFDCSSTNLTLHVTTNGGTNMDGMCSMADGTFTLEAKAPTAADNPVVLYIDSGETEKATTATLAADTTSAITINLIQDRLVLSQESATAMTNAKLGTGDNTNTGIRYEVVDGGLTVEDGLELHVLASKSFTPGGAVTTSVSSDGTDSVADGDVHIPSGSTMTIGTYDLNVGGDFYNSGTFTKSTGQITKFTATATGFSITPASSHFEKLTLDGVGGGWTMTAATTVDSNLTITNGTLIAPSSANLSVGGSFANSGTFTHNSGTLTMTGSGTLTSGGSTLNNLTISGVVTLANATHTVAGNIDLTGSTITPGSSKIVMSGTGGNTIVGGSQHLYDLTIDPTTAAAISMSTGYLYVDHTMNVAASDTFNLTGASTILWLSNANSSLELYGTIDSPSTGGTIYYYGTATYPANANPGTYGVNGTAFVVGGNDITAQALVNSRSASQWMVFGNSAVNRKLNVGTAEGQTMTIGGSLTIYANGSGSGNVTVDFSQYNPTVNIGGSISLSKNAAGVPGIISGSGLWTTGQNVDFTNGTYTATTGNTLKMVGISYTLTTAGNALYNLETACSYNCGLSGATTVTNNLTIDSGQLTAPAGANLTVNGNFSNSGIFTHNSGTVAIGGSGTSTITGATTFNSFTSTAAGKTIKFAAGTIFTFAGTFTITGTTGNLINVTSSTGVAQWLAHFNSAQPSSVTYADISWSGCDTGCATVTLDATSHNGDNNGTCWSFPLTGITISGVINTEDGDGNPWDCSSANLTVKAKVNGAGDYSGLCDSAEGGYSLSNVTVDTADVVTIWVDDGDYSSAYVTRAVNDTASITFNFSPYAVVIAHADGGPITNANLAEYSSVDNMNIPFTADGSTITFNQWLTVTDNTTYLPGGVAHIGGVGAATGSTITLDTTGSSVGYYFGLAGSTLRINANSSFDSNGAALYGTAQITYTSGTPTVTSAGPISSYGSGNIAFYNLNVAGLINAGSGTFTAHNLTWTAGTPSFTGANTNSISGDMTVNNGVTLTIKNSMAITGNLITSGTGAIGYLNTPVVTVSGTTLGGGSGNMSFYDLTKTGSGTTTWTCAGTTIVANSLTINDGVLVAPNFLSIANINEAGGVFNGGSGTVVLNSTTDQTLNIAGSFNNLTLNTGQIGYWKLDEASGPPVADCSGYGTSGTYSSSAPTPDDSVPTTGFTDPKSLSLSGSAQYVDFGTPSTISSLLNNKITLSAWINPARLTSGQSIIYATGPSSASRWNLWTYNDALTFRIGSKVLWTAYGVLKNDGTWQHIAGTYDGTTLKVYVNGGFAGQDTVSTTVNDIAALRLGCTSSSGDECFRGKIDDARIYNRALSATEIAALAAGNLGTSGAIYTLGAPLTVTGDLTLIHGTIDVSGSNRAVTVKGNWNNTGGILTPRSGTVTFNGTASGKTITTSGQAYNNVIINGSGGAWTMNDDMTVSGDLTLTNGTLTGSSGKTLTVAGDLTNNATFTHGSGTVVMSGTKNITGSTATTFNNLTLTGATVAVPTGGQDVTIAGALNVNSGKILSIGSGRKVTISPAGTLTLGGTINGTSATDGTLVYQSTTAFPTGGTVNAPLRMDATSNNQSMNPRTYGGQVELYSNSSSADRTVTFGTSTTQTFNFSSNLYINAANTRDLVADGSTYSPTVNVAGNLTTTGTGGGGNLIAAGDGVWTISGSVDISGGFYAPHIANLTPVWDNVGYKEDLYTNNFPGCIGPETSYSCNTSSDISMNAGFDNQTNGGNECGDDALADYEYRSYLKYDLTEGSSGIPGNATVIRVDQQVTTTKTNSSTMYVGLANSDTPNTVACGSLYALSSSHAMNTFSAWGSLGNQRVNTLNTGVTDVQSRLGGTIGIAIANVALGGNYGTYNSADNAGIKPKLRIGYAKNSTTPTLVMNGTGSLTTGAGNFYNLTLSGTITPGTNSTTYIYGTLDMTGGTIANNSWPLAMAGTATTIKGGGNTIGNLSILTNTASTLTGSDLGLSLNLIIYAGATLTIDSGRTLTDAATTATTITGTLASNGTGKVVFTPASKGPGATGTLTATTRFDSSSGDITSSIFDARTYGGAVELYNSGSSDRTVSTITAGNYAFSSTLTTNNTSSGTLTLDMNTTKPTSFTVTGALTIGAGTTLSAPATGTFNINGNFTNNGAFTHNNGAAILAGSTQQVLAGTLTGSTGKFYDLTVTNVYGSDPELSPSVVFNNNVETARNFTAITANTKLQFAAGVTATFQNIIFNGQSGTFIYLRSNSTDNAWDLNVAGTRSVSNTDVRDSNACGQAPNIDAADGTNVDRAGNSCWDINTLSFSISDTSIGFGSCSASTARYATGDTLGSSSDSTDAYTLTLSTSARTGYSLMVYGPTLTSGTNTIDAIGGTAAASNPGTEQFGMRVIKNSGAGLVSPPYNTSDWAYDAASTPDQIASHNSSASTTEYGVRYMCNISNTTEPGGYSTDLTYVLTGKF